ncbi:unnamed protein product [Phaedon cochleariae]|uniref:PHD-type domain-containing protein n=1 Tax=Phaedon cochleariae TaxID=80249 RepID=A0A9P0DFV1_PHACE|nr:unnamed protein product [Phaedon cochleariae]
MPDTCEICNSSVLTRHNPSVACTGCSKIFHIKCLNIPNFPDKPIPGLLWNCSDCAMTATSGGSKQLDIILSKLTSVQNDMTVLKTQQREVTDSLQFYGNKIDDFNEKLLKFEQRLSVIPQLQSKVSDIQTDFDLMRNEMDHLQQQLRMNNLEIQGVPEKNSENVEVIVNGILEVLGLPKDNSIESCHRIPHMDKNDKRPRGIIVKASSKMIKDSIITAIRARKGLDGRDIGLGSGSDKTPIFINDHLTPKNKVLYKRVRDICRVKKFQYWTRDCKIYIRNPNSGNVVMRHSIDLALSTYILGPKPKFTGLSRLIGLLTRIVSALITEGQNCITILDWNCPLYWTGNLHLPLVLVKDQIPSPGFQTKNSSLGISQTLHEVTDNKNRNKQPTCISTASLRIFPETFNRFGPKHLHLRTQIKIHWSFKTDWTTYRSGTES